MTAARPSPSSAPPASSAGWSPTASSTGASGVEVDRADDGSDALVARMAGATKTVWLTDPLVGDRFAAVTALAGRGRVLLRASGTEPLIRVMVEAVDAAAAQQHAQTIADAVRDAAASAHA